MDERQNHELISSSDCGAEDIGVGREPKDITVDLVYSDCTRSVRQTIKSILKISTGIAVYT